MSSSRPLRRATPPGLNIVYFADIRFPLERANGIQTMETCWALAARGHQVDLVVRPDTHAPPRDPFDFYALPTLDRLTIARAPSSGTSLMKRSEYLAFAAGGGLFGQPVDVAMTRDLGLASLLLRLRARVPLVYESHGYAPDVAAALPSLLSTATPASASKLSRLARREARVWRGADGYVTITAGLSDELRRRFGDRDRVAVIPDGVRLEGSGGPRPRPSSGAHAASKATVVYAGHLYAWKGVDILLQALAETPEVDGIIVGGHEKEPDLARLRALAATLGLAPRVTFTGAVAPSAVPARLAAGDILALPNPASAISTHATSPLKLFEYMASGGAIVASDLPAIREVLTHDVNGLLVAPGDPGALAAAIRRLAADTALRLRLGAAARAAAGEYSWSRRAERLERLFTQVLAARASASRHR
jgi:glycosyltransferase involved in cell wall biosynthesis